MVDARNDLPLGTRTAIVKLLNERLADAIDLGTQVQHWFLEAHLHARR